MHGSRTAIHCTVVEAPKDPQKELEIQLGELEERVDRLRALYEQYFMGYEKIEPGVQRKDVDRRFAMLRKVQIRNTALRFRFNVVTQKFNTYAMYWTRVCRQIEEGTFKRHVVKAARRFGPGRRLADEPSIDIDLAEFETSEEDMQAFLATLDAETQAYDRGGSDTIPPGTASAPPPRSPLSPPTPDVGFTTAVSPVMQRPKTAPLVPLTPEAAVTFADVPSTSYAATGGAPREDVGPRVVRPAQLPAGAKPLVTLRKATGQEFKPSGPPSSTGLRASVPPPPPSQRAMPRGTTAPLSERDLVRAAPASQRELPPSQRGAPPSQRGGPPSERDLARPPTSERSFTRPVERGPAASPISERAPGSDRSPTAPIAPLSEGKLVTGERLVARPNAMPPSERQPTAPFQPIGPIAASGARQPTAPLARPLVRPTPGSERLPLARPATGDERTIVRPPARPDTAPQQPIARPETAPQRPIARPATGGERPPIRPVARPQPASDRGGAAAPVAPPSERGLPERRPAPPLPSQLKKS